MKEAVMKMMMTNMTTEVMIIGELSIFSKQGIALKTEVAESTSVFRDHDRLKQDRYLFNFDTNCNFNEIELNEPITNLPIHPLGYKSERGLRDRLL